MAAVHADTREVFDGDIAGSQPPQGTYPLLKEDVMSDIPQNLEHTFTAPVGVNIKGETWRCVEMPNSADFFGTKKSVRVDATVNDNPMLNLRLMVTASCPLPVQRDR